MNNEARTTEKTAAIAELGANVAPEKASSKKKKAAEKKGAPKGQKPAKAPKPKAGSAKKATKAASAANEGGSTLRPDSKGGKVLSLISRPKGASLAELMKSTGWQAHSVRGFISGTLGTKLGLKVESAKREDGERIYTLNK